MGWIIHGFTMDVLIHSPKPSERCALWLSSCEEGGSCYQVWTWKLLDRNCKEKETSMMYLRTKDCE